MLNAPTVLNAPAAALRPPRPRRRGGSGGGAGTTPGSPALSGSRSARRSTLRLGVARDQQPGLARGEDPVHADRDARRRHRPRPVAGAGGVPRRRRQGQRAGRAVRRRARLVEADVPVHAEPQDARGPGPGPPRRGGRRRRPATGRRRRSRGRPPGGAGSRSISWARRRVSQRAGSPTARPDPLVEQHDRRPRERARARRGQRHDRVVDRAPACRPSAGRRASDGFSRRRAASEAGDPVRPVGRPRRPPAGSSPARDDPVDVVARRRVLEDQLDAAVGQDLALDHHVALVASRASRRSAGWCRPASRSSTGSQAPALRGPVGGVHDGVHDVAVVERLLRRPPLVHRREHVGEHVHVAELGDLVAHREQPARRVVSAFSAT